MDLNERELRVEMFMPPDSDPGNIEFNVLNAPIRVTHLPTGLSAIGEGQGSQVKNKEMALQLLKKLISKTKENSV